MTDTESVAQLAALPCRECGGSGKHVPWDADGVPFGPFPCKGCQGTGRRFPMLLRECEHPFDGEECTGYVPVSPEAALAALVEHPRFMCLTKFPGCYESRWMTEDAAHGADGPTAFQALTEAILEAEKAK